MSHYENEEEDLVAYFQQMLEAEPDPELVPEVKAEGKEIAGAVSEPVANPAPNSVRVADTAASVPERETESAQGASVAATGVENAEDNAQPIAPDDTEAQLQAVGVAQVELVEAAPADPAAVSAVSADVPDPAMAVADPSIGTDSVTVDDAVGAQADEISAGAGQAEIAELENSAAVPVPEDSAQTDMPAEDIVESVTASASQEVTATADAAGVAAAPADFTQDGEIQDWPIESGVTADDAGVVPEEQAPVPEPQLERAPEPEAYVPKSSTQSLESLLQAIRSDSETATQTETETQTETVTETVTETDTETVAETVTETAVPETQAKVVEDTAVSTDTAAATESAVETKQETAADESKTAQVELQKTEPAPAEEPDVLQWHNVDLPSEFQALFFMVRGVRFAVPLVNLGGIFEMGHLTNIVGRPDWHQGLIDIRGRKINVVDTMRWVKPGIMDEHEYSYIILLGNSRWAVACDELEGNRKLNFDNVKWRQSAGSRPWLAGIVKKEMCALFHVDALIGMFDRGFTLDGQKTPSTLPTFESEKDESDEAES